VNKKNVIMSDEIAEALEILSDRAELPQTKLRPFLSEIEPMISIQSYLKRIAKYAEVSTSCFVVAMVLIDRVLTTHDLYIGRLSVHRVIAAAVVVAVKFLEDEPFRNSDFAPIAGVTRKELNDLEKDFLKLLNFDAYVCKTDYNTYVKWISKK